MPAGEDPALAPAPAGPSPLTCRPMPLDSFSTGDLPDVSVIVIAHDVRDEVLGCLGSVRDHAGDLAVEALLVDNGSTDGTAAAVAERFPAVSIIPRERNEGIPARNHGLRRTRGRFRMFLDSDARLTANALKTMIAAFDEEPSAGALGPRLVYPDGRLQLSTRRYPPLLLPILRRPPWAGCSSTGAPCDAT